MDTLETTKREVLGKKVKVLRRKGITPANVFGHGIESVSLQLETSQLRPILARAGTSTLVSLKVKGEKEPRVVMVRDVQKNNLTGQLLHVDFYQVRVKEKMTVEVPLVFVGEAPAAKITDTMIHHLLHSVEVECLPLDMPHSLEVDLSQLVDVESAIHVKDIPLPKGVTLLADPEEMVVRVAVARAEVVEVVPAKAVVEGEEEKAAEEEEKPKEGEVAEKE